MTRRFRMVDVALPAGIAVVQLVGTSVAGAHQPERESFDVVAGLLLVAGPAALLVRRRWPVAVYLATFSTTLAYVALGYPRGPIYFGLIAAFLTMVLAGHRVLGWALMAAGYVAFLMAEVVFLDGDPPGWVAAVGLAAWLIVLAGAGEGLRVRRDRAADAARTREEEARRRASEERLRIARELHDVLAHNISLINVQAGVALHLMEEHPEQARTALTAIKAASKDALAELRSVLDVLRMPAPGGRSTGETGPGGRSDGETGPGGRSDGETGPGGRSDGDDEGAPRAPTAGLEHLDRLVSGAAVAGVDVRVVTEGTPRPLPPSVDLAAFRIVQEALTNVTRHAGQATATISLIYTDAGLTVHVDDDGRGVNGAGAGTGNGIRGMRERASALGGDLEAGPKPGGGFRVAASLPS